MDGTLSGCGGVFSEPLGAAGQGDDTDNNPAKFTVCSNLGDDAFLWYPWKRPVDCDRSASHDLDGDRPPAAARRYGGQRDYVYADFSGALRRRTGITGTAGEPGNQLLWPTFN